jgi:RNA polymerase sigma-70 factor, ECF subfamily
MADPSPNPNHGVEFLLSRVNSGDREAEGQLLVELGRELRRLARSYLRGGRPDQTLSPTALVNEAYLKILGVKKVDWTDRGHFLAVAARAMRQIVVDHARARLAAKRGREVAFVQLAGDLLFKETRPGEILALDQALERLSKLEPRAGQIIDLRFFGGFSVEETAEALGVSPRTVKREWSLGRAWLLRELSHGSDPA